MLFWRRLVFPLCGSLLRYLDHSLAELMQSYNPQLILMMTSRLCRDLQEPNIKDDTPKVN